MKIKVDDLADPRIEEFLEEHLNDMKAISPPESKHALDLDALRQADITFWSVWQAQSLVACGAIKELDSTHGEIKSMRTCSSQRGTGIGSLLLNHIIQESKRRGYKKLSLETGSMPFFKPAHRLYAKFGFKLCEPFAGYTHDANSLFMALELDQA